LIVEEYAKKEEIEAMSSKIADGIRQGLKEALVYAEGQADAGL